MGHVIDFSKYRKDRQLHLGASADNRDKLQNQACEVLLFQTVFIEYQSDETTALAADPTGRFLQRDGNIIYNGAVKISGLETS